MSVKLSEKFNDGQKATFHVVRLVERVGCLVAALEMAQVTQG